MGKPGGSLMVVIKNSQISTMASRLCISSPDGQQSVNCLLNVPGIY